MLIWRRHTRVALATAAFAAFALAGTVGAIAIDGGADLPTEPAVRLDPPHRAVVIGDSAIAALRWVPGADNAVVGFTHTLDLESCRRLFFDSCFGREGRRPPTLYEAMRSHADQHRTLVVATGYNDGPNAVAESFEAVIVEARRVGYERIVWWTLRADVDYVSPDAVGDHETFARHNRVLRDLVESGRYPEVVLADWGAYTADLPQWFVTDGVHYRQVGAWGASDYLSRKMAFLDGRACPFATAPNEEPDDPCPDPDVTGPVADIEALYPIGEDGVLCYEVGDERRVVCRVDTHVIRIERELRFDDNGDDVAALQTRLARFELFSEIPNGNFGEATLAAVRSHQLREGFDPTGVADRATLESLGFDVSGVAP